MIETKRAGTRDADPVQNFRPESSDTTPTNANQELKFHPLADIFPLMEGEEFDALVADIKANGLRQPIVIYEGMILDGRNRYRACIAAGVGGTVNTWHGERWIDDPAAYVISANIRRRHLTVEQKRELIAKVIAARPEASDRQIAKQVKVDHKTVGAIRKAKEATGEVSPVDKRIGADGKARKQPAQAPRRTKLERELDAGAFDRLRAEQQRNSELSEKLRAAKIKIASLESEVEDLKRDNAELRKKLEGDDGLDIPECLRRDRVRP